MIEYRLFTKPELQQWRAEQGLEHHRSDKEAVSVHDRDAPRIGVQSEPSDQLSLRYPHEIDEDAVCGICAFDGDRMIGRISILYFNLLINGRGQRCAVGSNFMVLKEYRKSAVGLSILLKAMNLGMPYFEASVSRQMRGILEKMKQFYHVDNSPVFQLGLDKSGIVQIASWDFYKKTMAPGFLSEMLTKMQVLSGSWLHGRKLLRLGKGKYELIKPEEGINIIEAHFTVPRAAVQIPWNRDLLVDGLSGKSRDFRAWLISLPSDSERYRLVTLYRRDRVLGQDARGNPKIIREAHLNEIYPPPGDDDPVMPLLAFASRQALKAGASVLHIHALTGGVENACRQLGLGSHISKAVFVAPGDIDVEIRKSLTDPGKWWCRAFNEDQLEEATVSAADTNSLLP